MYLLFLVEGGDELRTRSQRAFVCYPLTKIEEAAPGNGKLKTCWPFSFHFSQRVKKEITWRQLYFNWQKQTSFQRRLLKYNSNCWVMDSQQLPDVQRTRWINNSLFLHKSCKHASAIYSLICRATEGPQEGRGSSLVHEHPVVKTYSTQRAFRFVGGSGGLNQIEE